MKRDRLNDFHIACDMQLFEMCDWSWTLTLV
jgi:hypothetical protein